MCGSPSAVADPPTWRVVVYNGYGRNGYFMVDGSLRQLSMDAGTSIFADGAAGSIVIKKPMPGPIYFAIIAAVKGTSLIDGDRRDRHDMHGRVGLPGTIQLRGTER